MNLTEKQERLAVEIAHALEDMDSLYWHRKAVSKYSEEFLRRMLTKALAVPSSSIIKSRAAIYVRLVQGNGSYPRN